MILVILNAALWTLADIGMGILVVGFMIFMSGAEMDRAEKSEEP